MRHRRSWNWLLYPAVALGVLVVVGATGMGAFFRPYNVPARSMLPNLLVGDHLWASKNYYVGHAPERGEIALFLVQDGTVFIKRVIGLPGDTIEMKAGRLWINGAEVDRQEEGAIEDQEFGGKLQYRETLPGGVSYAILEESDSSFMDVFGPFQVPADSYFVMGDNRDNSKDSRVPEFGAVPRARFIDRPAIIYYSPELSRIGSRIN